MTKEDQQKVEAIVTYRFDAPPEDVFDAWVDPEFVGKWWFTGPTSEANTTRIDARLGGTYEIIDQRDGVTYRAIGEFTEFERPHRLAFTFSMPDMSDDCTVEQISITIEPDGDGARLTLVHTCDRDFKDGYESGWGMMFENLGRLFQNRMASKHG